MSGPDILAGTTPGPWRVIIDDDGNPLSGRPSVVASDELDCGIVHWDGFVQEYWRSARGDKEIHANAVLIAAAPTLAAQNAALVEALEAALPSLTWHLKIAEEQDLRSILKRNIAKARAALRAQQKDNSHDR